MQCSDRQAWYSRLRLARIIAFIAALGLVVVGIYSDWTDLFLRIGFPVGELSNPWVHADLALIRILCVLIGAALTASSFILWRYPKIVANMSDQIHAFMATGAQCPALVPLSLATLILLKTTLQLGLYFGGYSAYGADDFTRSLTADYWLYFRRLDLGWEGWLGLGGSGWLPFSDYLFGLGLALHRDIYLTPKIVNLVVSAIAVIAVYFLGRELFGRAVGFLTACLFAFQPWHVWLGISGMTSDLPSVVLVTLFGIYLVRWLRTGVLRDLALAAGCLGVANGFRYENWFFSAVFSIFVVFLAVSRWRQSCLTRRWLTVAVCALAMINVFPVVWMIASYVVLGDWLPALHVTNAWMVSGMASPQSNIAPGIPLVVNQSPYMADVNMLILAFGSFPIELALSIAGVVLLLTLERREPFRQYLLVLIATIILFAVVFKGRLTASVFFARYFLPFVVLALPCAGFFLIQLFRASVPWRNEGVVAACLILLTTAVLDIGRAFNYPAMFPKDAISAGWAIRGLQETGTISDRGKILIEKATDWGDLGIVALANRPERFVAINQLVYEQLLVGGLPIRRNKRSEATVVTENDVRGTICNGGFQVEACKNSVLREGFNLVILSSPRQIASFQETFPVRAWIVGRYHIFDMKSLSPSARAARG
jgi:Dolichyl-phosphate-mannose-protein mannosyltransferase